MSKMYTQKNFVPDKKACNFILNKGTILSLPQYILCF